MSVLTRIREITNLPTLPEVLIKLKGAISCGDESAAAVSAILEQDPSLASMVLRTANSAMYQGASSRRITEVRQAVMRIGFSEILRISSMLAVIRQFPNTNSLIGYRAFWRHSLTAAGLASALGEKIRTTAVASHCPSLDELFMSGLFHDIGILIYDQYFHEEFARIVDLALTSGMTYLAAEEVLAPRETHAMLGSALLETWRIPPSVLDPVRYHHTPDRAPQSKAVPVAILALTEYLLFTAGVHAFEGTPGLLDAEAWAVLGLNQREEESLLLLTRLEAEKTDTVLFFGSDPSISGVSTQLLRTI